MKTGELINFLLEIATKNPTAISFAAGRPNPNQISTQNISEYLNIFEDYVKDQGSSSFSSLQTVFSHYGPSQGLINQLLKDYLANDYEICVSEKQLVVSNGCQEAFLLVSFHEIKLPTDCIINISPGFVGFYGLNEIIQNKIIHVDADSIIDQDTQALNFVALEDAILTAKAQGLTPKLIYLNPDFSNPLGYCLSKQDKLNILELCHKYQIRIVEDSIYTQFGFNDDPPPTIKSMDKYHLVYHINSFSKVFSPSIRLGYIAAPTVDDAKALVQIKSFTSVNSCSLAQSVIGGWLIANNMSLKNHFRKITKRYSQQCDWMDESLNRYFDRKDGYDWQKPQGGMFFVFTLPFDIEADSVESAARDHNVHYMPLSFLTEQAGKWKNKLRLSFSYYDQATIDEGVKRLKAHLDFLSA